MKEEETCRITKKKKEKGKEGRNTGSTIPQLQVTSSGRKEMSSEFHQVYFWLTL